MESRDEVLALLRTPTAGREAVYRRADALRRERVGDAVFLRGIVEYSNACGNDCLYCGIRAGNRRVRRYTMSPDEIVEAARRIDARTVGTVVLQAGESHAIGDLAMADIIRRIRAQTPLAVTVSAGNRPDDVYRLWRDSGMDRYLLRFETTDRAAFDRLRPGCAFDDRVARIRALKRLGIQTGSGFMIGLPGERIETLADNVLFTRELELDMIGVGPFIAHADTPLRGEANAYAADPDVCFLAVAALRLINPHAHIPATTALDAMFPGEGRLLALQRGANIFMPNFTPRPYRYDYLLYPGKPSVDEAPGDVIARLSTRLAALGRSIGQGRGDAAGARQPA